MEHADILVWYNVYSVRIDVSNFNEVGLECQYPRIRESKALWQAFPINSPIRSGPPTIAVDEERKLGVVQEELAVEAFDMDWPNIFLSSDEV
jgi:hypothetical protein